MDNRIAISTGVVGIIAVALLIFQASGRGQAAADEASLKAQRAAGARGGPGGPSGGGPGGGPGGMFADLNLSKDQERRMQEAQREIFGQMGPGSGGPGSRGSGGSPDPAQFQQIRQKMDARMKEILTPDQFAKFQSRQAEMRNQMPGSPVAGSPRS